MGAAVRSVHAPRCRGMIVGKLAPRFSHHPHVGIVQTPTRTDAVEENPNLDTRLRPLAKRIAKLAANLI